MTPLITRRNLGNGWQTGNPYAIANKYAPPGAQNTAGFPMFNPDTLAAMPPETPQAPVIPGASQMGSTGPTGSAGAEGFSSTTGQEMGQVTEASNSMQRQQQEAAQEQPAQDESGGLRKLSPQRRYFWGTGRIDARPTQAPGNQRTDWQATFGPDAQHMGSAGTTWAERQATNQSRIATARDLRGLSPY